MYSLEVGNILYRRKAEFQEILVFNFRNGWLVSAVCLYLIYKIRISYLDQNYIIYVFKNLCGSLKAY